MEKGSSEKRKTPETDHTAGKIANFDMAWWDSPIGPRGCLIIIDGEISTRVVGEGNLADEKRTSTQLVSGNQGKKH
jgi:hypothetical protein